MTTLLVRWIRPLWRQTSRLQFHVVAMGEWVSDWLTQRCSSDFTGLSCCVTLVANHQTINTLFLLSTEIWTSSKKLHWRWRWVLTYCWELSEHLIFSVLVMSDVAVSCPFTAGVIDEDYRGNVGVVLFNFSKEIFEGKLSLEYPIIYYYIKIGK